MKKNRNKKNEFAKTKKYPGENHPAYLRHIDSDKVEYVTFTKHDPARIYGEEVEVRKLSGNIDPKLRGVSDSNVVNRVYVGKRSSLGKRIPEYSFNSPNDKEIVKSVLKNAPRIYIEYTTNSKSKKKK